MIHLLLWLQALLHLQTSAAAPQELNGAIGGSVTFPLDIQAVWQVKSVFWTSKGAIATVIPEGPGNPPQIIAYTQQYKGRLIVAANYDLTIGNLSLEDAGTYRADVSIAQTTNTTQFSLRIWDLLTEPSVMVNSMMVNSTASDNGHCNVTLTCSVARGGDNVTFSWMPLGPETSVSPYDYVLSIAWRPGDPPQDYTCTATNPISNSSHTIPADRIHCPGMMNASELSRTTVRAVVLVLVVVSIILVGVLVIWWQMKQRQRTTPISEPPVERDPSERQCRNLLDRPANPEGGDHPRIPLTYENII
ncbi:SLAM family member 9-like isoform X1 [Ornithorhynchus anatinus]|uniref:Ig-like domain-containing protein n=1 Tax=Ornithorhynchus anatinus TaxID=9258 RepID=A0A6I8NJG1_ORNAN|nr:SLAM family member 9-like isoform X1 [Ornithorhynchus anatinus]